MRFRLVQGIHSHFGREYHEGDIIESDADLRDAFPQKFKKVYAEDREDGAGRKRGQGRREEPERPRPIRDKKPPRAAFKAEQGLNVTKKFPFAVDQDFKVYRDKNKRYWVFNADVMDRPVNASGVHADDVDRVIENALEAV